MWNRKTVRKMTNKELHTFVGKTVEVIFRDDTTIIGVLGFADGFSAKHGYRKANYFYIADVSFKVSHIKKIKQI